MVRGHIHDGKEMNIGEWKELYIGWERKVCTQERKLLEINT